MAAAEAAKTSDAPVAEKTPEHSTAEPAEPPKTEAQDGEIPAVEETEAEQHCRKKEKHSFKKFGWAYGLAAAFALLLFVTFAYTSLVPREVNATVERRETTRSNRRRLLSMNFWMSRHIKYCEDDYIWRRAGYHLYLWRDQFQAEACNGFQGDSGREDEELQDSSPDGWRCVERL